MPDRFGRARLGSAALLLAGSVQAAWAAAPAPSCHAEVPADIAGGAATWLGPCTAGQAEGIGMLRVAGSTGAPRLFYGRMVAGRPYTGVMPSGNGDWIVAWRFDSGLRPKSDPDGNRQSSLDTFRAASAGAMVASRRYGVAGNATSARFYADQSHKLDAALDD